MSKGRFQWRVQYFILRGAAFCQGGQVLVKYVACQTVSGQSNIQCIFCNIVQKQIAVCHNLWLSAVEFQSPLNKEIYLSLLNTPL